MHGEVRQDPTPYQTQTLPLTLLVHPLEYKYLNKLLDLQIVNALELVVEELDGFVDAALACFAGGFVFCHRGVLLCRPARADCAAMGVVTKITRCVITSRPLS